ncbi:MAG: DUF2865 domain-containing protein [Bauldia sp.]
MHSAFLNLRRTIGLIAVAVATLVLAAPASADYYCDSLAAQLAALPRDQGAPNPGRSNAIAQELNRAQWESRRFNCTPRFFGPPPHPYCQQINAQIAQLRAQLRGSIGNGGTDWGGRGWSGGSSWGSNGGGADFGARAERQRILGAMASYRCPMQQQASGAFRTLCVRTCDGYYFPISFSAARSRLKIDDAVCKGMYPEGEAELFIHRSGGEESESAVSLKGEPYAKQPYAFTYIKQFTPACRGLLTTGLAGLAERFKAAQAEKFAADARDGKVGTAPNGRSLLPPPIPMARPAAAEDPETLANRAGDFVVEPVEPVALVDLDEKKPVRIVGGFFYTLPTPEESAAMTKLRQPPRPIATDNAPVAADMLPMPHSAADGREQPKIGLP